MASVPHPSAAVLLTSAFSQRAHPLPTQYRLPLVESTTSIAAYTFCNATPFVRWTGPVILTSPLALTPARPSTQRPPFAPGAPRRLCLAMRKQCANMTTLSYLTARLTKTPRVAVTGGVMPTALARVTRSAPGWPQPASAAARDIDCGPRARPDAGCQGTAAREWQARASEGDRNG